MSSFSSGERTEAWLPASSLIQVSRFLSGKYASCIQRKTSICHYHIVFTILLAIPRNSTLIKSQDIKRSNSKAYNWLLHKLEYPCEKHTSSSPKECLRLWLGLSGMLDDITFFVETKINLVSR